MNVIDVLRNISKSPLKAWVMNKALHYMIPFNAPHGFWVDYKDDDEVLVRIPYRRKNLNHVKGIHACALATACEYASGLAIASGMDSKTFRYLLSSIKVDYTFQAKTDIVVSCKRSDLEIDKVIEELKSNESTTLVVSVYAVDKQGNKVCFCQTTWHIKYWDKVRTK